MVHPVTQNRATWCTYIFAVIIFMGISRAFGLSPCDIEPFNWHNNALLEYFLSTNIRAHSGSWSPQVAVQRKTKKKAWTFIVYMSADNDLRNFAIRNIKQMLDIGSTNFLDIFIHLDIKVAGGKKITQRYYIEKNRIVHLNAQEQQTQSMDSGDPQTLISACQYAVKNFPSEHYALVLWNHGTGPIDPGGGRIMNPSELFVFNPETCLLELDRSTGFLNFATGINTQDKGICFDDTTGHYLTNQKLEIALHEICNQVLKGGKLDLIAFDACLMATIEIANLVKKYAHITLASQEVELGSGYPYGEILKPFITNGMSPKEFATHIVDVYSKTYSVITEDYTQSALMLKDLDILEANVNHIAQFLIACMINQKGSSVKSAIRASRSKFLCTYFDDPNFVDLHHFYINLYENIRYFEFNNPVQGQELKEALRFELENGITLIESLVFANRVGKNLSQASGISIYFPERGIHASYPNNSFAKTNAWFPFLVHYLRSADKIIPTQRNSTKSINNHRG